MEYKTCSECNSIKSTEDFYKQSTRGKFGVRGTCKSCDNNKKKLYRQNNKEHVQELKKQNYIKHQEKNLQTKKNYRQTNKGKINALVAARKKIIKQRTPKWLTEFDKLKIKCIYSVASMLTHENKEPWHVDHIIPLQGKLINGLHVPSNLRPMRGIENIGKKNKFEVNYAE
jgi:hypothetical protein